MSEDIINQAIQLSKAGQPQEARKLLRPLLEAEPENEKAWLWYANSFDTVEDKIKALKNCLVYCPNSKMANDGIHVLMAKLPVSENSTNEEASDLAADLQNENVQFTDDDTLEEAEDGREVEFDHAESVTSFDDQGAITNLDDRLPDTSFVDITEAEGIPEQESTATANTVVDFRVPESRPEDRPEETNVKDLRKPVTGYPTGREYRIPFIIFFILGVILFIILALIITILLVTSLG